jgi:hypothetical protein
MLSQVIASGSSQAERNDIVRLYDEDQSATVRFQAMEENGLVEIKSDQTVEITKIGKALCLAFLVVRKLFMADEVG